VETRGPAQVATIVAPEEGRILGRQASFLTAESLKPASAIRRDDGMSDPAANAGHRPTQDATDFEEPGAGIEDRTAVRPRCGDPLPRATSKY
jgi:hypothetical protein